MGCPFGQDRYWSCRPARPIRTSRSVGRTQCRADQNAYHEGGDDSGGGLLDHPCLKRTLSIGQNPLYGRPNPDDARSKPTSRRSVAILLFGMF